jgi:hypothetical protein
MIITEMNADRIPCLLAKNKHSFIAVGRETAGKASRLQSI